MAIDRLSLFESDADDADANADYPPPVPERVARTAAELRSERERTGAPDVIPYNSVFTFAAIPFNITAYCNNSVVRGLLRVPDTENYVRGGLVSVHGMFTDKLFCFSQITIPLYDDWRECIRFTGKSFEDVAHSMSSMNALNPMDDSDSVGREPECCMAVIAMNFAYCFMGAAMRKEAIWAVNGFAAIEIKRLVFGT